MNPCPACAATHPRLCSHVDAFEGVTAGYRVVCRRPGCPTCGPVLHTPTLAIRAWDIEAERAARLAYRHALRLVQADAA